MINIKSKRGNTYDVQDKEYNRRRLRSLINWIEQAVDQQNKTTALRFDLHFPTCWGEEAINDTAVICRFVDSLRKMIQRNSRKNAHSSDANICWAREIGEDSGRPHYHCLLLVNGDSYRSIGRVSCDGRGLFGMTCRAWASALGLEPHEAEPLVHIPTKALYTVRQRELDYGGCDDLIYRSSYLAKSETKPSGSHLRSFQTSQVRNRRRERRCVPASPNRILWRPSAARLLPAND